MLDCYLWKISIMESEIFDYPVDGTIDLHMFRPKDVKSALSENLIQCRIQGILQVRIIHGRGQGVLRQILTYGLMEE